MQYGLEMQVMLLFVWRTDGDVAPIVVMLSFATVVIQAIVESVFAELLVLVALFLRTTIPLLDRTNINNHTNSNITIKNFSSSQSPSSLHHIQYCDLLSLLVTTARARAVASTFWVSDN